MKKLLFGSVAFVALIAANAASAADLGLPVKSRALEPEWNWSGFYAGLNAGYARGNTVWHDLDAIFTAGGSIINESNNAFTGGGQIGYNWNSAMPWSVLKPISTMPGSHKPQIYLLVV